MSLRQLYWIGGSPCAGKSGVAKALAARFGLGLYHCDDAYDDHLRRGTAAGLRVSSRLAAWSWEQIFLRPVEDMVKDELEFYREEWRFVLEDLGQFERPTLVEGAAAMPELVAALEPEHAVWMVPTEAFQRHHYRQREWAQKLAATTTDPERAFENWMQRDAAFALEVRRQAEALGYPVLVVDGSSGLEDSTRWAAERLGLL